VGEAEDGAERCELIHQRKSRLGIIHGVYICVGLRLTVLVFFLCTTGLCSPPQNVAQQFVGRWQPAGWGDHRRNLGIVLTIAEKEGKISGTVRFHDPHSEHESQMVNPELREEVFTFDVDDQYVGRKLSFTMTIEGHGKRARVRGSGGELILDFRLVKVASSGSGNAHQRW
jgi:hypothetical protein